MNNKTAISVFWKLVGVVIMFLLIEELQTAGVFIDILIMGVFYEATSNSKELAEDTDIDERTLKQRIEALEKKLAEKN